ncbi:MAG: helix-turn-helix domain-containing protein [Clostridia bacterium]|nr:helix-turn-helix domain-containing protein [Clostridia bacterium]MBQ6703893.1 helix-turn-helix domain-containing protein [Clostridia bacterium]
MYKSKLMTEDTAVFFNAVLSLKTPEECCRFFEDVATIGEVQSMAQRLQVAKLLDQGLKYADIAERTGASTATISRVSRCLSYGADGYRLVLERMEE